MLEESYIFWEDNEIISRQFVFFSLQGIEYIVDFTKDDDFINGIQESYPDAQEIINNHIFYSLKFTLKERYEEGNVEQFYQSPENTVFTFKELNILRSHLEKIIYKHYLHYKPDGYIFIAATEKLIPFYQRICKNRSNYLSGFKPITMLGEDKNGFIIKTPQYKE